MEIGNISHNENTTNYIQTEINNISNKRIKNELNCYYAYSLGIKNKYFMKILLTAKYFKKYKLLDVSSDNDLITVSFFLKVTDYKNTIISLIFNKKGVYPWKPPRVKIFNQHDYLGLLQIDSDFLGKINVTCLCCSSITCHNNWNVQKKICNILDEIYENFIIKSRYMDRIMCKKVTEYIFGTYLPIIEFL
jgi:hypothetical protein